MNLSLSIYDVFANAVPGSLYLALTIYLGVRFGWIDLADLAGLDTTFALVGAVVASYLLGQVAASTMRRLIERFPLWGRPTAEVRERFRRRNPTVADRPFVDADVYTLLAGLRQVSPEAATEVDRSRAAGIMLRSACPAFLIGAVIAFVEAVAGGEAGAAVAGVGLVALAGLSLYEGQIRSTWARMHTFECAVWMPDVDARLVPPDRGQETVTARPTTPPPPTAASADAETVTDGG